MTDTFELIKRAKNGDEAAFEKIVINNSALVWSIARRFLGRGADADDLYQLGCLGLLKAIRGFDETLGNQFSTYAVPKITGEIRRFLRDDGVVKVSRSVKEKAAKVKNIARQLQESLGREPTLSEISKHSGFTPEEIAQFESATLPADSLNRELGEDGRTLEETVGGFGLEEKTLEYISLADAMKALPSRERVVIMLRFFRCMTQQQTAKVMNISQVQVSRIEHSAIGHLKEKMASS